MKRGEGGGGKRGRRHMEEESGEMKLKKRPSKDENEA